MPAIGDFIKCNSHLIMLNISINNGITDRGIEILAEYLNKTKSFKHLSLEGCRNITDRSIPVLLRVIESSHIEEISIIYTSITVQTILVLPLASNALKYGAEVIDMSRK